MPSLSSIIPIVNPPIEMQNDINFKKYDTINVYIDLKNAAIGLFVKDIAEEIIYNSRNYDKNIDSSIFQSIVLIVNNWIKFIKHLGKKYNIIFTNDIGESVYHTSICSNYKSNRKVRNTTMEYYDELANIRNNNVQLAEKIVNRFNNVYFYNLLFLESDFLSYYLINHYYNDANTLFLSIIWPIPPFL